MKKNYKREAKPPFILATKFILPIPKENTITRPRLLSLLKEHLGRKLILIMGDAGYGKSTFISQFLYQEKTEYVFYDLDENDQDFSVFLLCLVEAMRKMHPGLGERTEALLLNLEDINKNIEIVMGTLINEIIKKRKSKFLIILDDYQIIPDGNPIYRALDYFIEHLPPHVRIVISTRTMPVFPSLAKWRSKQDVFELTKKNLRFSDKEIKILLKTIYKTTLATEELKRLVEHTEGWVTGLQMILQHTGGEKIKKTINNYLESNMPLFEYFAREILKNETKEVQEFLLKSSVLEWLIASDCDAIIGVKDSKETLKSLEHRNLFTTLVSLSSQTYKYHYLFKEFLRYQLENTISQRELKNLHLNAARFYISAKNWDKAISHLIKVKNFERAAKIIEKIGNDLFDPWRINTLYRWIDCLPKEIMANHPWLLYYKADVLLRWGKWSAALKIFKKVQKIFHRMGKQIGEATVLHSLSWIYFRRGNCRKAILTAKRSLGLAGKNHHLRVKLLNTIGVAYLDLYNYALAQEKLKEALALCHRYNYPKFELALMVNLAYLHVSMGEISEALDIYKDLFNKNLFLTQPSSASLSYNNVAHIYMLRGEFKDARLSLEKAFRLTEETNYKQLRINVLLAEGRFYRMTAEYDNALRSFDQVLDMDKEMKQEKIIRTTWEGKARCYLAMGELDKSRKYINRVLTIGREKKDKLWIAQASLILGDIELGVRNYKKAEEIFLQSHKTIIKKGTRYNRLSSHFCLANLYRITDDFSRMKNHLQKAIRIAKTEKYEGILIEQGRLKPDLLQIAREADIEPQYSLTILRRIFPKGYLEVNMLGDFRIQINGKEIPKGSWKIEKAKFAFAYLLANRTQISTRDRLMDILFTSLSPEKAGQRLKTSIFFIRQALGTREILLYEAKGYRINPKVKCWIDVEEYLHQIEIGENFEKEGKIEDAAIQYQRAVKRYRGDYLEDIYDSWCEEPREYYLSIYLRILKFLANYFCNRGEYEESIKHYRKIIEKDEFMEEAYCGIMLGYAKIGNQREINKYYQRLARILRDELNTEPLPETTKVYKQLIQ